MNNMLLTFIPVRRSFLCFRVGSVRLLSEGKEVQVPEKWKERFGRILCETINSPFSLQLWEFDVNFEPRVLLALRLSRKCFVFFFLVLSLRSFSGFRVQR